jgi:hypothetical protein
VQSYEHAIRYPSDFHDSLARPRTEKQDACINKTFGLKRTRRSTRTWLGIYLSLMTRYYTPEGN